MQGMPVFVFKAVCRSFRRAGIDVQPHLEASGITPAETKGILTRLDWDKVSHFMEGCSAASGLDAEGRERVGEFLSPEIPYLQIAARLMVSPAQLHDHAWKIVALTYPYLGIEHQVIDDRTIKARVTIPESRAANEMFLRMTAGASRSATKLLGLAPAEVRAEIEPREGRYLVLLPVPSSAEDESAATAARALVTSYNAMLTDALFDSAHISTPTVKELQQDLGLTRAEARVAARVATGLRPEEIAKELHISVETVRTHLKRTYGKTHTRGQVELALLVRHR